MVGDDSPALSPDVAEEAENGRLACRQRLTRRLGLWTGVSAAKASSGKPASSAIRRRARSAARPARMLTYNWDSIWA